MLAYDNRILSGNETVASKFVQHVKLYERKFKDYQISLKKSPIGLGFTLGTVENWEKGGTNVFVKKILESSPAKIDGRLQIGDRIRKINGVDVTKYCQSDVVKILRSVAIGDVISITVQRCLLAEISHINIREPQNQHRQPPQSPSHGQPQSQTLLVPGHSPSTTSVSAEPPSHEQQLSSSSDADSRDNEFIADSVADPASFSIDEEYTEELHHFVISISGHQYEKVSNPLLSSGVLGISVECRSSSNSNYDLNNNIEVNNEHEGLLDNDMNDPVRSRHLGRSDTGGKQFFVKSILEIGAAYKDGRLHLGDEIVAVQGIDVRTGRTFVLPPNTAASATAATQTNSQMPLLLLGDVYHCNLASVFLKNLQKLGRIGSARQLRSLFRLDHPQPLSGLRTLIRDAGSLYSAISLVVVRRLPSTAATSPRSMSPLHRHSHCTSPGLSSSSPTLSINSAGPRPIDLHKKLVAKKSMTELNQLENIFELNPDYRFNYSNSDSVSSIPRYLREDMDDLHGRHHDERFIRQRELNNFGHLGILCSPEIDASVDVRSEPGLRGDLDEFEFDRSLLDASGRERLFSYFSKDDAGGDGRGEWGNVNHSGMDHLLHVPLHRTGGLYDHPDDGRGASTTIENGHYGDPPDEIA